MKNLVILFVTFLLCPSLRAQVNPGLQVESGLTVLFGKDTIGAGIKSFWLSSKAAFRTGAVGNVVLDGINFSSDAENWDADNIGLFSFATGFGTLAKGRHSVAMGFQSKASGQRSLAIGSVTEAKGFASTALGENTRALGDYGVALGYLTTAGGDYALSMGEESVANGYASNALGVFTAANGFAATVVGMYNDTIDPVQTSIDDTTRLFMIGNGNSNLDRSNALVVQKNGKVGIGINKPLELLDVNGSTSIHGRLHVGPGTGANEFNLFDIGADGDVVLRAKTAGGSKEMIMGLNSTGGLFGTVTGTDLRFRTNNTHRLTINSAGDVGINTTGPTAKLDVNGTTLLRSTLTTNGVAGFTEKINLGPGSGTNELNIFDIGSNDDAIIRAKASGGAELVLGASSSGGLFGTVSNDILNFRTNNTNKMSITSAGDVGIGDSTPEEKLDVHGNLILDRGSTTNGLTRNLIIQGARSASTNDYARIDFQNIDDDGSNTEYVGARIASRNANADNEGTLEFWTRRFDDLVKRFEINQIAQFEFHTTVKYNSGISSSLWPNNDAVNSLGNAGQRWLDVWAFNPIIQISDAREKTQIEDINYGLTEILSLRPVSYKWRDRTYEDPHLGLIAQEVDQIIPEVVVDKDYKIDPKSGAVNMEILERLGMRSTELIPVLIKAIQQQQEIIIQMKSEIKYLSDQCKEIRSVQEQMRELKQIIARSLEQQ